MVHSFVGDNTVLGVRDEGFAFCNGLEDVKFSRSFGVDVLHDYTGRSFFTRRQSLLDHKGVLHRPESVKVSVGAFRMDHRKTHKPEFGYLVQILATT